MVIMNALMIYVLEDVPRGECTNTLDQNDDLDQIFYSDNKCRNYGCSINPRYLTQQKLVYHNNDDIFDNELDTTLKYNVIENPDDLSDIISIAAGQPIKSGIPINENINNFGYITLINSIKNKMNEICESRILSPEGKDVKGLCYGISVNDGVLSDNKINNARDNMCDYVESSCVAKELENSQDLPRYDIYGIWDVPYGSKCDEGYSGHPYILNYCYNENEGEYIEFGGCTPKTQCERNQYQINQTNDAYCIHSYESQVDFITIEGQSIPKNQYISCPNIDQKYLSKR